MNGEKKFFNRELSWIEFNNRVLGEACSPQVPLLERFKFLAIASSNFDEFFMVRVASLKRAITGQEAFSTPDGLSGEQVLSAVCGRYRELVQLQYEVLQNELFPLAREGGLIFVKPSEYTPHQLAYVKDFFRKELFNVLTPIKVEPGRPFPFTGNLRLHLAYLIQADAEPKLIVLEIPTYLGRLVWLPSLDGNESGGKKFFTLLEDVISLFIESLVPGYKIRESLSYRITRDADLPLDEQQEEDFVSAMSRILENRMHSLPVRLEISQSDGALRDKLMEALSIDATSVYTIPGPINLKDFMSLGFLHGFEKLKYPQWDIFRSVPEDEDIWEMIRREDLLLHHPYESFGPVIRLLSEAAIDPQVLSIRMTLYRTSGDSPVVLALAKAAQEGKQVTVLMELKARFDEEQNMGWAQTLERAGVIVIYGVANLKVHSKALLIVRRESDGIVRYAHLGTGNYHDKNAKLYTDLGLFTARVDYTMEVAQFFNAITGYSTLSKTRYLVMAPNHLKLKILDLIQNLVQQAKLGVPCALTAKMNSLADTDVIQALYAASEAGVIIRLNVRGICMLIPGQPWSRNIQVISVVDRFLEHSRIFYFQAGDQEEVYLSSADWMYRNLERRVELMFPVLQQNLKSKVISILKVYFQDTAQAHELGSDGHYHRRKPAPHQPPFRCQQYFLEEAQSRIQERIRAKPTDFVVLKKPVDI